MVGLGCCQVVLVVFRSGFVLRVTVDAPGSDAPEMTLYKCKLRVIDEGYIKPGGKYPNSVENIPTQSVGIFSGPVQPYRQTPAWPLC